LQHANNSVLEGGNWTTTNTNQGVTTANGSIVVNQWYHVVLSYDGTTLKMYKNGQLVGSRVATISYANQIQFLIGGAGDGPSPGGIYGGFNGKIDDVGFWDRALTFNEVQELYNGRPSVLWSTSETSNKISVTPMVTTKYYANLTDGIATCTDSVTITVDNLSAFNPLQDTVKVCGDSTVLDAGAGYATYNWSNGATTRTITAKASGKYFVSVATAAGCSASDTSFVSIVKAKIIQRDTTICKGSSITLAIDTSINYTNKCTSIQLSKEIQNGLIAYYPFCQNYNEIVSGNNARNNGTSFVNNYYGFPNSAVKFNGNSDLTFSANITNANSTEFTTCLWAKMDSAIDHRLFYYPNGEYEFMMDFFAVKLNNYSWQIARNNDSSVYDKKWHFLSGVFSKGNYIKFFVDGKLVSYISLQNLPLLYLSGDATIGSQQGRLPTNGSVDDISVYNKALSDAEIASLYLNKPSVLWSNGSSANTNTVTPASTTKYFVNVTDGITTCRDSITVTVSDIGSFNPLQDTVKVCGDSTVLDAGAGYATYNWSNGATTRTITAKASGKYFVNVATAAGCSASDTSYVSIVKAKILQRDTTICKGTSLVVAIDSSFSSSITNCSLSNLPSNIKAGLVAYYPFCGNANDISGNNNNATVFGASLTADRFGILNSAYSFNQSVSNNYMSIASSSSLNIIGSLTLSFWFSAANTNAGYILDRDICNPNPDWSIRWEGSKIIARYGIVGQDFEISSSVIPINTWNLVTVVRNTSTGKLSLFINGLLASSISYSAINFSNNLTNIYIGESVCNSSSNPNFSGKLDDFYIFNRALDNSEILQLKSSINTVLWSNGATGNKISVTPTATTKYFVSVTDGVTTCKDSITVTVSDIGSFNSLQDTVKICGDSIMLDAGAGYDNYNWSNGATTRTITAKASGKYIITVANASGCSASDTSVVSIIKAKILHRDTTICKGSSITLAIDSTNSGQTVCNGLQLPMSLRNGLVGYFPFCGNANDASGNGNNGSVVGANLISDRFGNPNSAYNFSGSNQYISVTASNLPTTTRSTSLWFKTPDPAYRGNLLGYGGNGTCGTSYFIGGTNHRGTGKLMVTGHCSANETSVAYVPQADQWVHLVTTSSSNGTKIYINGKLIASSSKQFNTIGSKLFIGCISSFDGLLPFADSNGQMWLGAIDDVFIYNRELSESEVASLYNSSPSILWSTGATTPSITVNPTFKTTYTVTVTDGINTCTDSVVVDVSSSELKVTDPAAVCSPGVVNLTAAAITSGSATGLTYTYWKDANATQALANPDKVSVSGTYYIVGTSSTGCTSAPTAVKVTVNPLPTATIIAPSQTAICDKSSITLTARGGTSYQWLLNGSAIAGATDSTYAASQAGSYEVNVIALGCTSKVAAPVNLMLIKAAIPKFSNSSTCIDVPVSFFNETDTSSSGSVNFVWDFGDGQTSTLFNPVYTYKKSGAYIVKLTVTPKLCNSLPVSFTKNITVDIPPVGIKYPNVLAVKNKATQLSARFIANGYTYLWMPSTGLNNGVLQKPIFNASNEQLYRIRLTSASGCITMDTVKVSVYDSSDIFVPKAFSPNKDGKNDLLQPFLVNITTLKFFRIYNRWGQLMFQSSDSKQGWDGMYNYKPQPLETYTWIAEGIDGNGTTIFRKGQTVLIR